MAFKLKSGNASSFKNMGSSPAKHTQTPESKLPGDQRKGDTSAIHNKNHADGKLTKDHVTIDKKKETKSEVKAETTIKEKSPAKHTDSTESGTNRDPKHAAAHNKRHADGDTHGEIGSKDNKWDSPTSDSPAKQNNLKRIMTENKIKLKKAGTFYDKGSMPKNFNTKGSSGAGPKIKSKVDIKRASKVKTQNFRNEANKIKTVSSKTNKGSKVIQQVVKKQGKKQLLKKVATKIGSRLIPGVGWALAALDAGSWAYKHKKEIGKHAKEVKKKRLTNPGDHGRPKW